CLGPGDHGQGHPRGLPGLTRTPLPALHRAGRGVLSLLLCNIGLAMLGGVKRAPLMTMLVITSITAVVTGCSASGEASDRPVQVSTESPDPTPTPTPTPTPAEGTRAAPFPVGAVGKYADDSMWKLSVAETNPDAWPEL